MTSFTVRTRYSSLRSYPAWNRPPCNPSVMNVRAVVHSTSGPCRHTCDGSVDLGYADIDEGTETRSCWNVTKSPTCDRHLRAAQCILTTSLRALLWLGTYRPRWPTDQLCRWGIAVQSKPPILGADCRLLTHIDLPVQHVPRRHNPGCKQKFCVLATHSRRKHLEDSVSIEYHTAQHRP